MTLKIERLSYRIDGNALVDDLTASIAVGDVIGLIGPNGAGKSTLANLVTGFLPPSSGAIYLNGHTLKGISPERIARLGVGRTFQTTHLPWNLTTEDCLQAVLNSPTVTTTDGVKPRVAANERATENVVTKIMARFGLSAVRSTAARDLSFGQQRLLGLAMAIASPSNILILDEPFAGLKSVAVEMIVQVLHEEAKCRAIITIDHTLSVVRQLASRLWFMHRGHVTEFDNYVAMEASDEFRRHYLGVQGDGSGVGPNRVTVSDRSSSNATAQKNDPVVVLSDLDVGYGNKIVIQGVGLKVFPGDVVCVIGLNGSGKSTLLRAILGLAHRFRGQVNLFGKRWRRPMPDTTTRAGVRLLAQDHRLFRTLTLRDNLTISAIGFSSEKGLSISSDLSLSRKRKDSIDAMIEELQLGGTRVETRRVGTFSGGEQARVALAQMRFGTPKLILLDEPTSGMDGLAIESLRVALETWKTQNIPVVMVEHALDFVVSVATRIIVLSQGSLREVKLSTTTTGEELARELIG